MNSLRFERLRISPTMQLGQEMGPGLHVFIASQAAGRELAELTSGLRAPRRGRVTLTGVAPHRDPKLRLKLASLLAEEPPLLGATVADHVRAVSALRGTEPPNETLEYLFHRTASSLTNEERRAVALELALVLERPPLAVLHEPLDGASPERTLERLHRWANDGSIVVCTTGSRHVADSIGGSIWKLSSTVDDDRITLLVRSPEVRALAARLAAHPAVGGLILDESRPRDLLLTGDDLSKLGHALQEAILAERCAIDELTPLRASLHDRYLDTEL